MIRALVESGSGVKAQEQAATFLRDN